MARYTAVGGKAVFEDRDGNRIEIRSLNLDVGVGGLRSEEQLPNESGTNVSNNSGGAGDQKIREVWDEYVAVHGPRDKALHPQEAQMIRSALRVATVSECKLAIRGNKESGFHQGENERGKKYNRLSHILKGKQGKRTLRENIDMFIEVVESARHGVSAEEATKITRAKREVQVAADMPESVAAQERGQRARVFLMKHGWSVVDDENGRPQFELPIA